MPGTPRGNPSADASVVMFAARMFDSHVTYDQGCAMKRMAAIALRLSLGFLSVVPAGAQAPAPPPAYGMPISLEQAKKVMAGAEAEAKKNNWPVVIVILDSGGQLVMLQRLDNAQWGSVEIAKEKARSAVALRRPTKALQDLVAQGGANLPPLPPGYSLPGAGNPSVAD